MCCPGCQAVATTIVQNGLQDYYRFRTKNADKGDELLTETLSKLQAYDDEEVVEEFVVGEGDKKQIQLTVEGISCAACGWLIEKQLSKLNGVLRISVNVTARRAALEWDVNQLKLSEILKRIEQIGYHALPFQPDQHEALYQKQNKDYLKKLGLSGLMSMQVMMLAIGLYFGIFGSIDKQTQTYFHWVSLMLTAPVVLYCGRGFYSSAWNSLRAKTVNMDLSISVAIWGTFISSVIATIDQSGEIYFESVCMFIFLLLISRYIEHRSRHQAAQISANMLKFIPLSAIRLVDGQNQPTLAKKLKIDDLVLVKAGETIPVDGIIVDGQSRIDESMLTGEFEHTEKSINHQVFGGTINKTGVLKVKATRLFKDALVNQIVRMQEFALAEKPRIAHFADRASRHFVIAVLAIAAASYFVWLNIEAQRAFWIAIAVLVATCPCALALATPSALTSAMAKLNKLGMLIKRADVLEQLPSIDSIVFDKTGTLTEGKFSLHRFEVLTEEPESRILNIIANLENYSEHPIAKAFTLEEKLDLEAVIVTPGFGISATVENSHYRLGSAAFMQSTIPNEYQWASIYLENEHGLIAVCSVNDKIKQGINSVLKRLEKHKQVILSGDNKRNVENIAEQLNITHYYSECSPEQKLNKMAEFRQCSAGVMMIGDGINDAPVMAAADVSIAVGNASDIAKRSADIVLLGSDLTHIPTLFEMAKRTRNTIKQNMFWAIGYNILILPLALTGYLTPWMAVIGMSLSSILVVTNSVKLTR